MKLLIFLRNIIDGTMKTPTPYSWFHIVWFVMVIGFTVFMCWKFKNCSDKTLRLILMISFFVMASFEIIKQFKYSTSVVDNTLVWDYQWFIFPFQLCSTPIYVFPFTFLLKDGKARDAALAYMMTFSLFGGASVFFVPDVFTVSIIINIQSMLHHGIQAFIGFLLLVHNRKRFNYKHVLYGCIVFAIMFTVAISLNEIMNAISLGETFNMFFINRTGKCHLPILSSIWGNVPYVIFAMIYFVGFVAISFIIFGIFKGIMMLVDINVKKQQN